MTFNTQSYSWSQFWHSSRFSSGETVTYLFLKTTGSASLSLHTSPCFTEALNFICLTRYFVFLSLVSLSLSQTLSHTHTVTSFTFSQTLTHKFTHPLTHTLPSPHHTPSGLSALFLLSDLRLSRFFQSRPTKNGDQLFFLNIFEVPWRDIAGDIIRFNSKRMLRLLSDWHLTYGHSFA